MSQRKKPASIPASPAAIHDWMAPVNEVAPCGIDLEYDPEFVVLAAGVASKDEAQYGDFVGTPLPVNWSDVDRDCRRLMMRSKDMRLAVLFTRCRTRLTASAGLAEGLAVLAGWLTAFPDLIHPQPDVDEDRAAALEIRMNALQSLTDAQGLLSDVREIVLIRSTAMRLQVRDVERAFARPRADDALAPESVQRQLDELRMQLPSPLASLDGALRSVQAIEDWSRDHLGQYAPDLSALTHLLRSLGAQPGGHGSDVVGTVSAAEDMQVQGEIKAAGEVANAAEAVDASVADQAPGMTALEKTVRAVDRNTALDLIREARYWFEQHEPSSPIPVLLKRAEQFAGKRYADVVKAIPAELLEKWESES